MKSGIPPSAVPFRRALVTGPRGFIGRHLVARLRRDGVEVLEWAADVRTLADATEAADVVFHLAAASTMDRFRAAPAEAYDVNVRGTAAALEFCRRRGARCVLASSSAVYAEPPGGLPLAEDAPLAPATPYGESKRHAEDLCLQLSRPGGVPSIVLRLFNPYGPGQSAPFLIPYLTDCLLRGRPVRLRCPDAVRDFVYVDDVVDAFVRAAGCPEAPFAVFNIGSGVRVRVRDVVTLLSGLCGADPSWAPDSPREGEVACVMAECSRAHRVLGWQAKVALEGGLRRVVAAARDGAAT